MVDITAAQAIYPKGPSNKLGNQTEDTDASQDSLPTLKDHIDDAISQVGGMTNAQKSTMRGAMIAKFREPSFAQSFIAGAKDFGHDISKMLTEGELSGPSMENRKKLWEAQ